MLVKNAILLHAPGGGVLAFDLAVSRIKFFPQLVASKIRPGMDFIYIEMEVYVEQYL